MFLSGRLLVGASAGMVCARQTKVEVCHINGQDEFHIITVAAPAYDAHIAHGDAPVDTYYPDADGDGFGADGAGATNCPLDLTEVTDNTDCDDTNDAINPGATEVERNGIDDDCNPDTPDGCPGGRLDEKCLFVTSQKFGTNLGGLTGADAECQALADTAGLAGTYMAWLSDAVDSPDTRFTKATVPYRRLDGVTIADDYTDLVTCEGPGTFDPCLKARPRLTETGGLIQCCADGVWSNTRRDGTRQGDAHCDGWTSSSHPSGANKGRPPEVSSLWTQSGFQICAGAFNQARLYCFEQ